MTELLDAAAAAIADDRLEETRELLEQAFRELRASGDVRRAAVAAMRLSGLHFSSLGNRAAGRGWLERSRQLLEEAGPCVEWGYWELALLACDRPDIDDLARSAARALELAAEYGDPDLEVRALADAGLALVTKGHVSEGFARLDQALACLSAGEVRDPYIIATALCSVLSSCDRAGDVARAEESVRFVEQLVLVPNGGRPKVLSAHCKVAFGGALCSAGRLTDAEATILDALAPGVAAHAGHRIDATARLAELRLQQGRVDDAAELLAPIEDAVSAAGAVAEVHLRRGEPDVARAMLRRALKQLTGDVLRGGPLAGALVEVELARGDVAAAADAAKLLRSMATVVSTPSITALSSLADGRLALAEGKLTDAVDAFENALAVAERPTLVATIHLELAAAHDLAGDQPAAIASGRAAHAAAQRVDASALCDRAAATLRRLGATAPRPAPKADTLAGLTARETDILAGLQRGETNAEIAARLYLSPKTVEHHVSRLLAKLGVRTRTEAAAVAARATLGAS